MDLKVVIGLTPDEVEMLSRPVHGQGGFQSLLRRIQKQLNAESRLELTIDDIRQIVLQVSLRGWWFSRKVKRSINSSQ